jgi:hypothetical protein
MVDLFEYRVINIEGFYAPSLQQVLNEAVAAEWMLAGMNNRFIVLVRLIKQEEGKEC